MKLKLHCNISTHQPNYLISREVGIQLWKKGRQPGWRPGNHHKFQLPVGNPDKWLLVDLFDNPGTQLLTNPGVNLTIILWAAFTPVDLYWTYWCTDQSLQHKSWAYLLVVWTGKVGCSFVGETDCTKLCAPSAHLRICTLRQWVGEIDPKSKDGW